MAIIINVKVKTQEKKFNIELNDNKEYFIISLKNKAENNLANKELISQLSKLLNIEQNDVKIISGFKYPKKIIKIDKISSKEILIEKLNLKLKK